MDRAFYVDVSTERCVSYEQLLRAVAAVEHAPEVLPWDGDVNFFVQLLAAMRDGVTIVLVDGPGDVERAIQTPHPQPLSPEYRGAGSNEARRRSDFSYKVHRDAGSDQVQSLGNFIYEICTGEGSVGLFTSGTTGKPKLVLHSLASLTRGVRSGAGHADDVWGLAYHPAHMAGLQVFFQSLANQNTLVRLFGLPVEQIQLAIEEQGITHLSATPTFLNLLCSTGQVYKRVGNVTSGGELLSPMLRARLATTFPNARMRNIYASTEVGSLLVAKEDTFYVPERFHGLVRVLEGELLVHRTLLAPSLQQQCDGEYYATGDCVEVLQQDPLAFRITSRQGDWINVGGYKVNPHRIEALLLAMREVQEATVYGRENSVTGGLVCCDVVLAPGHTLAARDVYTRLSEHLPGYMIPRVVRTVDSIASTSSGKKQRTE